MNLTNTPGLRRLSGAAMTLILGAACASAAEPQMAGRMQVLPNPGFEKGTAGWEIGQPAEDNQIAIDEGNAHNGKSSLKLSAKKADDKMIVTSEWFAVTPDAGLDGEVWLKADDVKPAEGAPQQGRRQRGGVSVAIEVMGPDKTTSKMTLPIASASGSLGDWQRYQGQTVTSKDCAFARYLISMTNATGAVWLDDMAANYTPLPNPDPTSVVQPAILPHPWLEKRTNDSFDFGKTIVFVPANEQRLKNAVTAYLGGMGVESSFGEGNAPVVLRFVDLKDDQVRKQLESSFADHDAKELGNEGYFLSVQKSPEGAVAYIAANTEQGRFYGLQTLKQLTADKKLHGIVAFDTPTMHRRGIVMSSKRYNAPDTLDRMAASKMNTSWSQGSFTNDKFKQKWRTPFTEEELGGLKKFIDKADANFITTWMAFGPRGDFDHRAQPDLPRPHPGEMQYSSDADIDIVVNKMDQLYGIGLRRFGINFDDLQNYHEQVLIGADKDKWGTADAAFAKAHAYMFSEIMKRLRARHPDDKLEFMTVPYLYWYPSKGNGAYLKELADGLPKEVEMITCSYTDADIRAMDKYTGRPTMIWHNYFVEDAKTASHRLTNLEYGTPFIGLYTWTDPEIRKAMSGIIHLMPQAGETPEDEAQTSWKSAADWQWAPDRYDPLRAFQAAAAQYNAGKSAK